MPVFKSDAGAREKIYLAMSFAALAVLFVAVWQVYPVVVGPKAALGLASYLPPLYWLGLILITLVSILVFLDSEVTHDFVPILVLIILGLFLFGIRVFLFESPQDTDSYYPISLVFNLLASGHIDVTSSSILVSYDSWPAIHFLSASLLTTTGIELLQIIKYTPLFWIVIFVLTTYSIGKRLNLEKGQTFSLSIIALSSWWLSFSGFYYPRIIAMIFFQLIITISIKPKRSLPDIIMITLLMAAIITSHSEVALATILGLFIYSLYRRDFAYVILFFFLLTAWYLYLVSGSLQYGLQYVTSFLRDLFSLSQMERYQAPNASVGRLIARYSQLLSLAIFSISVAASLWLLVRQRIASGTRNYAKSFLAWTIGVSLFGLFGLSQAIIRTFIKCIIPASGIIAVSSWKKSWVIPVICAFIGLSLFVNYAALAGFGQVIPSSLAGAKFMASQVKPDNFFGDTPTKLPLYFDPDLINVRTGSPESVGGVVSDLADLSPLDGFHYLVFSSEGIDANVFAFGRDPYLDWLKTPTGIEANLIYDSSVYKIYQNRLERVE